MSDKNLFLGDSTYPHTQEIRPMHLRHFGATVLELKAADRIEQLERELAEAQKDTERYHWIQDWLESRTSVTSVFCKAASRQEYDQAIDAAIKESK